MIDWPITLAAGPLVLRPLRRTDAADYAEVRAANAQWLGPWEASSPEPGYALPPFPRLRRMLDKQARRGTVLPLAMTVDGRFCGQITVNGFQWGSLRTASLGYWIDQRMAGRGLTPLAVALVTDYCFFELGLHRVEINIRPENTASLRVVEKLGFRYEGLRRNYMHINGAWADHSSFALLADEAPAGLLNRYMNSQRAGSRETGLPSRDSGAETAGSPSREAGSGTAGSPSRGPGSPEAD